MNSSYAENKSNNYKTIYELELTKVLKLSKIFLEMHVCLHDKTNSFNESNQNTPQEFKPISLKNFHSSDLFIQLIILDVSVMYIFKIIAKELANVIIDNFINLNYVGNNKIYCNCHSKKRISKGKC